jgi:soluble lytic murein transglycosylase-like protein
MKRLVPAVLVLAAAAASAQSPAKVTITNDARGIHAYRTAGGIRTLILSILTAPHAARTGGRVPAYLSSLFDEAAKAHGVDARLVTAVAGAESAYDPGAVSRTGACGIMQLMPSTARLLGVTNVFDTRENVFGGARYLRTLLDTFGGNIDLAVAAYNAGPGAVQKYGGVPPYPETRAYVRTVRAAYDAMR